MAAQGIKKLLGAFAPYWGAEPNQISADIDARSARIGGYYLGHSHQLIHRHRETIEIDADQAARWTLAIDFKLPTDLEARCGEDGDEAHFLFPLVFLKKSEGPTGFWIRDENGNPITLPDRGTRDWVSSLAATEAALRLGAAATNGASRELPRADLEEILREIAGRPPYGASVILNEPLHRLDPKLVTAWKKGGLVDDLEMLVEHSLVWLPLRGRPGEQRTIEIGHDVELQRPPFLRWNFVELEKRWWRREKRLEDPSRTLQTGTAKYGRCGYRFSFAVLGERLAQPLGWMPIQFDFPTIYTRRCTSYHFELTCPSGLSPRGLKIALDDGSDERTEIEGLHTTGTRATHAYLPGGRFIGDLLVRATVGIGGGTFPVLWLLMGAMTSLMLWILAGVNPTYLVHPAGGWEGKDEIAAGILLIVPALLGATVIGGEQGPKTRLLGGARILLLTAGLSSVGATVGLLAAEPFGFGAQTLWTVCATVATLATVPLAASWLLSHPFVWRRLAPLNSRTRQYVAFAVLIVVAYMLVRELQDLGDEDGLERGVLAVALLSFAVPLILLASNRFPVPMGERRRFLSLGAFAAALTCVLGCCIELRAAFDATGNFHDFYETAEDLMPYVLLGSLPVGLLLSLATRPFGQKADSAHVAPEVGRALIAGERIRELRRLRSAAQESED